MKTTKQMERERADALAEQVRVSHNEGVTKGTISGLYPEDVKLALSALGNHCPLSHLSSFMGDNVLNEIAEFGMQCYELGRLVADGKLGLPKDGEE